MDARARTISDVASERALPHAVVFNARSSRVPVLRAGLAADV